MVLAPPTLVDADRFLTGMSGRAEFRRTLVDEPGLKVTHHLNTPGSYYVDDLATHAVAVQCSPQVRHSARIEGRRFAGWAGRGMSWIKPAGTAIAWAWDHPTEVVNIWLGASEWEALTREATGKAVSLRPRFVGDDPVIAGIAWMLRDEGARGNPCGRLFRDGLASALIARLAAETVPRRPPPTGGMSGPRLRRVLDYMEAEVGRDVGLAELAVVAGLSPRHLCTAFRHTMGSPPHRHMLSLRIDRAKVLLLDPALSIEAVSRATGFAGPSQFSRAFRRVTGMSPRQHRDAIGSTRFRS